MKECIFTDKNGEQLIVRHRKSAVFFLRETDPNVKGFVSPFWEDKTPVVSRKELIRKYNFSPDILKELFEYLKATAIESWKEVTPKVADSLGADYNEYYDRELDNNGYLKIGNGMISLEGPVQKKTDDPAVRLYKFNKRKFESFIYDLEKVIRAITP